MSIVELGYILNINLLIGIDVKYQLLNWFKFWFSDGEQYVLISIFRSGIKTPRLFS